MIINRITFFVSSMFCLFLGWAVTGFYPYNSTASIVQLQPSLGPMEMGQLTVQSLRGLAATGWLACASIGIGLYGELFLSSERSNARVARTPKVVAAFSPFAFTAPPLAMIGSWLYSDHYSLLVPVIVTGIGYIACFIVFAVAAELLIPEKKFVGSKPMTDAATELLIDRVEKRRSGGLSVEKYLQFELELGRLLKSYRPEGIWESATPHTTTIITKLREVFEGGLPIERLLLLERQIEKLFSLYQPFRVEEATERRVLDRTEFSEVELLWTDAVQNQKLFAFKPKQTAKTTAHRLPDQRRLANGKLAWSESA
jgi:hypothetical protein